MNHKTPKKQKRNKQKNRDQGKLQKSQTGENLDLGYVRPANIFGASFSRRQCTWLGVDWRHVLIYLQKEGFRKLRISAYWDELEPEPGLYNFLPLIEELEEAERLGFEVLLTIGMKAQRYPEYYIPIFYKDGIVRNGVLRQDWQYRTQLWEYLNRLYRQIAHFQNITGLQVENEPLDPSGENFVKIHHDLLFAEIDYIKSLDEYRKVYVNLWGNSQKERGFLGELVKNDQIDAIGFDIYPHMPTDDGFKKLENADQFVEGARAIRAAGKSPVLIELQAEPWEEFDFRGRMQDVRTISPEQFAENVKNFAGEYYDEVYLWGVEFWFWRNSGIINL